MLSAYLVLFFNTLIRYYFLNPLEFFDVALKIEMINNSRLVLKIQKETSYCGKYY